MPREQFLNHGQDLWRRGGTSGTRGEASPTVRRAILPAPPARQVEAARPAPPTPHPLGPAPSLTAGGTGSATGVSRYLLRSHGERCGCGRGLDSARLEAAAAAPRLRSSPHALSPHLRREPVAQPARRERINSGRIMINASTPPAGGGGGRLREAGQGARQPPLSRGSSPIPPPERGWAGGRGAPLARAAVGV